MYFCVQLLFVETNTGSTVCVAVYQFKNYAEDRSTHNRLAERRIHFMKMAAGSHIGFELGDLYTKSAIASLSLVLKFGLDPIYSFGDIVIFIFCRFALKLPIHAHFWGVLGA